MCVSERDREEREREKGEDRGGGSWGRNFANFFRLSGKFGNITLPE